LAIRINSNIASLNAQRRLGQSSASLQRSFEHLSSGLRIVRPSDDAAGLAVAKSLETDGRIYTQGIRNINDGISYLDIAEGGLSELKTIIFRSKELATQSSNGTMSDAQRQALDREYQALSAEYNRILSTVEFNGRKLFDVGNGGVGIQFGYGDNDSINAQVGRAIQASNLRLSVGASGAEPNGTSSAAFNGWSGDRSLFVFSSNASNMVSGDTNGVSDIFVRDMETGVVTRVNLGIGGAEANAASTAPAVSVTGRYIGFNSTASNLVANDTNGLADVFMLDTLTGALTRLNVSSTGAEAVGGTSGGGSVSGDGRWAAIQSSATNLVANDTNGVADIFLRNNMTGEITRVNTDAAGTQANGSSFMVDFSGDGRYLCFGSDATNLVAGDTNGVTDFFLKDLQTGAIQRVTVDSNGVEANAAPQVSGTMSSDGRYIAYASVATNLVANDTNAQMDVFVRDTVLGTTRRVSVDALGAQGNNASARASMSDDGRFVAFTSGATNLVAGDTNGFNDVFIYDMITGAPTRINVAADGTQANGNANLAQLSSDGRYVSYASDATNLGSSDTNGLSDVYMAVNTAVSTTLGFTSGVTPLVGLTIGTQATALAALKTLNTHLTELNSVAGEIGSTVSRFQFARATMTIRTDNVFAAASQILDVDVATESSNLTKNGILQQAGSAILSQANIQPQIALQLLSNI